MALQPPRRYRDRDDSGDALAAGIIGFALGAAILGSQNDASRPYGYRSYSAHVASCRARYRSYDATSNTYLGLDGTGGIAWGRGGCAAEVDGGRPPLFKAPAGVAVSTAIYSDMLVSKEAIKMICPC